MFTSGHLVSQRVEGVRVSLHEAGWLRGPGGRCPGGGNPAEPPGGDGGGEKEGWKRRTAGLETGTHEPPQRPERAVRRGVQAGTQPQLPACCSFARSPGPAQHLGVGVWLQQAASWTGSWGEWRWQRVAWRSSPYPKVGGRARVCSPPSLHLPLLTRVRWEPVPPTEL